MLTNAFSRFVELPRVTDGQTDGRTHYQSIYRDCIALRGKAR